MNKSLAIGLIVLGVLLVAVVFLAVPLHLGNAGFGYKKIAALVVGLVALVIGLVGIFSKGKARA